MGIVPLDATPPVDIARDSLVAARISDSCSDSRSSPESKSSSRSAGLLADAPAACDPDLVPVALSVSLIVSASKSINSTRVFNIGAGSMIGTWLFLSFRDLETGRIGTWVGLGVGQPTQKRVVGVLSELSRRTRVVGLGVFEPLCAILAL